MIKSRLPLAPLAPRLGAAPANFGLTSDDDDTDPSDRLHSGSKASASNASSNTTSMTLTPTPSTGGSPFGGLDELLSETVNRAAADELDSSYDGRAGDAHGGDDDFPFPHGAGGSRSPSGGNHGILADHDDGGLPDFLSGDRADPGAPAGGGDSLGRAVYQV